MRLNLMSNLQHTLGPFEHPKLRPVTVLFLGGGEMGIYALLALLNKFFQGLIEVVKVWPDWLNNSKGRYLKHYGESELPQKPGFDSQYQDANEWLQKLTPPGSTPQKLCGRILEQLRLFDAVVGRANLSNEDIVFGRYDDQVMLKLLIQTRRGVDFRRKIDVVVITSFGAAIGEEVIGRFKALGGRILIVHPGEALTEDEQQLFYLPTRCRGAQAIDSVVTQDAHDCSYQWYILDCDPIIRHPDGRTDGWDSGALFAKSLPLEGPVFRWDEKGDPNIPARVRKSVSNLAPSSGVVVSQNIIRLTRSLDELLDVHTPETVAKMGQTGWTYPEIIAASTQTRRK